MTNFFLRVIIERALTLVSLCIFLKSNTYEGQVSKMCKFFRERNNVIIQGGERGPVVSESVLADFLDYGCVLRKDVKKKYLKVFRTSINN